MRRREPDRLAAAGAAGRSAALAAFAAERLPGDATLAGTPCLLLQRRHRREPAVCAEEGEWRFPALAPAEAQAYLNELVDGYLLGMSQPLLLLPESGGAWLKACYDAEKDVILMDEETQQKARSKFLQTYEGNMVVSGEGADIWYQRLWRSLEPAHYEEIIAQTQRYLLPLYRYHRSTQI